VSTSEQDDPKQHDHDEGNNPRYLHPAWCAGVGPQVSPVRILYGFKLISSIGLSHAHFFLSELRINIMRTDMIGGSSPHGMTRRRHRRVEKGYFSEIEGRENRR